MARKHHSCVAASKKAGKRKTWFKGKCRTSKQKTAWKRHLRKSRRK